MATSALKTIIIGLCMWALTGGLAKAVDGNGGLQGIRALAEIGNYQEAMEQLEQYLEVNPDDAEGRFLKGIVLSDQKNFDEAIEVFTALTEDYPQLPEPHNNLAVLYASRGNYPKARDALLVAIKTHPSYATAHENLGDIYAMMATEAYNKALELDDGNESAKVKLGMIRELFPDQIVAASPSGTGSQDQATGTRDFAPPSPPITPPVIARQDGPSPSPASGSPITPSRSVERDVLAAIDAWASAWSNRDVAGYLAAYAPTFTPDKGISFGAWKAQRRSRILAPKYIDVSVSEPRVTILDDTRVRVSFVQTYRSNTYRDVVRKSIDLVNISGSWRFVRERSF